MTPEQDTRLTTSTVTPASYDTRIPLLVLIPLVVVVLVFMFWGFNTATRADVIQGSFSLSGEVRSVRVEIDVGSLTLSAGTAGEVTFSGRSLLATTTRSLLEKAASVPLTLELVDDGDASTLVLREIPRPEGFAPPSRLEGGADDETQRGTPVLVTELHVVVLVPPGMPAQITLRKGDIKVDSRRARTDVRTGSGTVYVTSVEAELEVENRDGEVLIDNHLGPLRLRGNGLVRVSLTEIRGPVDIVSEKGEVGVYLPSDGPFKLLAHSPASRVRTEFGLPKESIGPAGSKVEGEVGIDGPPIVVEAKAGTVSVWKIK